MGRAEVLAEEDRAWDDLMDAIAAVPAGRWKAEGVVPGWSTHDVVWHIAYWIRPGVDAVVLIRQGQDAPDDDEATPEENEAIAEAGRAKRWPEVVDALGRNRTAAREALEAFDTAVPDDALEFFSDYTTDHYREHESQIRSFAGRPSIQEGAVS